MSNKTNKYYIGKISGSDESRKYKNDLRNIHISNDNGSFTFYVDLFCPLSLPRLLPDLTVYMINTAGVL